MICEYIHIFMWKILLYTTMRRHTPPHCTKKEQQEGVHLLAASKGKWKGWRGPKSVVDAPNMKNTPRQARFSRSRVVEGMGSDEHVKHADRHVLHVWWMNGNNATGRGKPSMPHQCGNE